MNIIPVIDLKNQKVVHAKQGNREQYQPINSKLCQSADIFDVIEAFLNVADFKTFYIADLDAITGQGNNDNLIIDVVSTFPKFRFWVDKGYLKTETLPYFENYLPVLGSESYSNNQLIELTNFGKSFVLSLDYAANGKPLGASELFVNPNYWLEDVIIMTLARVGSNQGPDLERLRHFCKTYPNKNFTAAGGVRNLTDLLALAQIGVKQVLVASALHSETINSKDLVNFRQKNTPAS